MTRNDPEDPNRGGWRASLLGWAAVALILGSTSVLIFVPGITPQEWAAEVTFVAAHLLAAEVVMSGHRRR
jgi:hypothetical protein